MEKFRRVEVKDIDCVACTVCAETLNAHSDATEALAEVTATAADVAEAHTNALEILGERLLTMEGVLVKGYDPRNRCHITNIAADSLPRMTAEDAADIILAEQDKLLAKLNDPKLRVWTRGVVALMVGALREHGREEE